METNTQKLIEALQRLAESIDSMDGVANAVIFEAAQRLEELQAALQTAHASLVLARNERDEARTDVLLLKGDVNKLLQENWQLAKERDEARNELHPLKLELSCALAAEERAKKSRDEAWCRAREAQAEAPTVNQQLTARPEPSRLEIAAMLKAGCYANPEAELYAVEEKWWIEQADALIAAAEEGQ